MTRSFCDRCELEVKSLVRVELPPPDSSDVYLLLDLCPYCLRHLRHEARPIPSLEPAS